MFPYLYEVPKGRIVFDMDLKVGGGSPLRYGGSMSTGICQQVAEDENALGGDAIKIGGANTDGSDKTATGNLFLPVPGATQFKLEWVFWLNTADANFESLKFRADYYDGAASHIFQVGYFGLAVAEWQYYNDAGAYVDMPTLTAVTRQADMWQYLSMVVTPATNTYDEIRVNHITVEGLTGYEGVSTTPDTLFTSPIIEIPTTKTAHVYVPYHRVIAL